MEPITVLLVDNHTVLREGLRHLIEQEPDLRVLGEAEDGASAIRLAAKLQPQVTLMEVNLPDMEGPEAMHQIRAVSPRTALLILTSDDSDQLVFGAIAEEACGYLLKTQPSTQVIKAIRAAARGESMLDPSVARKLLEGYANLGRYQEEAAVDATDPGLTPRETDVLNLLALGDSNREIAEKLELSDKTVKQHVTKILRKLGVQNRSQAIIHAVRSGLVR